MNLIGFFLLTATLTAAFAAGYRIGKTSPRAAIPVAVACASLILIRALLSHFPDVEFALLPYDAYAAIRAWWPFPFALMLFGIGITHVSKRGEKFGLSLLSGILFFSVMYNGWATLLIDTTKFNGVPDRSGIVRQTTKFSCGAAAAASLLTRMGYPASEREMAELSGTNFVTGTDEIAVAHGLRKKLENSGRQVRIIRADWNDLRRLNRPAMANIRLSLLLDHWIVVLNTTPDAVAIADPSLGLKTVSRNEFLDQWLGVLVLVE